jgi:hypothetical protein
MREIWAALRLDGIEMSYGQFRTYVWRIRKRVGSKAETVAASSVTTPEVSKQTAAPTNTPAEVTPEIQPDDPLANIRRELERKRKSGFNYSPFPDRTE